jgi:hypothetical protein
MTDIPQSPFLSAESQPPAEMAPASATAVTVAADDAGATDHIHEIFIGARKWIDDDHRFVLDEKAFMEAIEPPPLFMQRAAG